MRTAGVTATGRTAPRRGERVVAVFEAAKGALVLAVGFGLLAFVHEDVQQLAEDVVGHFHLSPASRYPRIFLRVAADVGSLRIWLLAALALGYAGLRFAEAFGLWRGRRWAEWLAVASAGLYVPIEVGELFGGVTWLKAATLAANVVIVAYVGRNLLLGSGRARPAAPPD